MKLKTVHVLFFIILMNVLLLPLQSFAQTKTNVITMLNGEKKTGEVISVNESMIKFFYEDGKQIFTDSRTPAFGGIDSYNSALKASMKRSPFKIK